MSLRVPRRRAALAVASAAILGTAMFTGSASAAVTDEPPSTPVPISTPDGLLMSYVLNATHANPTQTRLLEKAVVSSGGVVVQSYAEIGVVVAQSQTGAFRQIVAAVAGNALQSVGATRTVGVSEGTPDGIVTPWSSSGAGAKKATRTKPQADGPVAAAEAKAVVADPREAEQWDMQMIRADQAHVITDGSRKVVVGVLDSGIDPDHPDLAANIDVADSVNCTDAGRIDRTPGAWYPTTSDHGTHVAGTIAAARNGIGIVGVAPKVRVASVKVVNDDGYIYPEYAVCGFMWAGTRHMDVTNNSYYVDPFEYYCEDQPDQYAAKEAVRRAVAWSTKQGTVHAAAAGNSANDLGDKSSFQDTGSPDDGVPVTRTLNSGCNDIPTELDGVVTVSSVERYPTTTLYNRLSSFSNRGLGVIDVAAPGSAILSTVVAGNGYGLKSGTSMASPHAAGVLALMKSVHPTWKPAQMVAKLRLQANDQACSVSTFGPVCTGPGTNNSYFGEGLLDALDAVS